MNQILRHATICTSGSQFGSWVNGHALSVPLDPLGVGTTTSGDFTNFGLSWSWNMYSHMTSGLMHSIPGFHFESGFSLTQMVT